MTDRRIDVHAHYLATAYVEALQRAERWLIGGIPVPQWSPELALEFMDAHGIALQVLSISDPGVEFLPQENSGPLASACNDYVAGVCAERPDRFGAFAALAPRDVEDARGEAARALDELGLCGVGLLSSYEGRSLGRHERCDAERRPQSPSPRPAGA
jgi:6-methylsalicylate decarboxylase